MEEQDLSPPQAPTTAAAAAPVRKRRKSQERWLDILAVTTELFCKRGFYATSMQDISDKVGIRKASLYYYVDSKERLLFEILKDLHHGGTALVDSVNFESSDVIGQLHAFLVQIGIYTGKHADRLSIYARDFDYLDGEQQKIILAERRIYWDTVSRLITIGQERGQISKTLDVPTTAQTILNGVVSISVWYKEKGALPIEQIAVQTAGLLTQGLAHYGKR